MTGPIIHMAPFGHQGAPFNDATGMFDPIKPSMDASTINYNGDAVLWQNLHVLAMKACLGELTSGSISGSNTHCHGVFAVSVRPTTLAMLCSLVTDSKIFVFEHYSLVVRHLCNTTGRKGLRVLSLPLRLPMLPSTLLPSQTLAHWRRCWCT